MSNIESQRKLGLLPECPDQRRASLAAPQLTTGFLAQMRDVLGTEVRQGVTFEVAPDVFGRVEFRRVGGQSRQHDVSGRTLHVVLHPPAAMHRQAVPDHQQPAFHLAAQVAQELHRLRGFDAAAIKPKVKLPPGDAGNHRKISPSVIESQLGRLADGCPGAHDAGTFREAAFVHKDQRAAFFQGLFFSAGQVCFFQRAIAFSSRCVALSIGRWRLQPRRPSSRQTWPGCRRTPLCRWINWATRGKVQRSLRKPWACAPWTRAFSSFCRWPALSLGLRPSGRRFHAAPLPSPRCWAQRRALTRLTPQRRATSAWATPWAKSRMPSRRRCSMPSRSRLVFLFMQDYYVTYLCESQ